MSISNDNVSVNTYPQAVTLSINDLTGEISVFTRPQNVVIEFNGALSTSAGAFIIGETPNGAVNGSNATYTTAQQFEPASVSVFINGVNIINGVDYITTGTNTIILNVSPVAGDYVRINYKIG
jgi:hypothetical protein